MTGQRLNHWQNIVHTIIDSSWKYIILEKNLKNVIFLNIV